MRIVDVKKYILVEGLKFGNREKRMIDKMARKILFGFEFEFNINRNEYEIDKYLNNSRENDYIPEDYIKVIYKYRNKYSYEQGRLSRLNFIDVIR